AGILADEFAAKAEKTRNPRHSKREEFNVYELFQEFTPDLVQHQSGAREKDLKDNIKQTAKLLADAAAIVKSAKNNADRAGSDLQFLNKKYGKLLYSNLTAEFKEKEKAAAAKRKQDMEEAKAKEEAARSEKERIRKEREAIRKKGRRD
ncbi:hypothetical protein HDU76_008450, partial [Blyttiomyces sp. JEL0837]